MRGKRLAGDWLQLRGRVPFDTPGLSSPPIKPPQRCQGGVHRGGLLSFGEARAVVAQIVAGRLDEIGLILLPQPGGKTAEVAEV